MYGWVELYKLILIDCWGKLGVLILVVGFRRIMIFICDLYF